jgi:hypothetical protein
MAHILAPRPASPILPLIFNVDGVVGASPSQNIREDVLLVQYAFKVIADSPSSNVTPEELSAYRAVVVDGKCGPITINAIRAHQQDRRRVNPGKVVDGRVSPARGGYSYGGGQWTIYRLNGSIWRRNKNIWPRLDKIANCPPELIAMVNRLVVGSPTVT